MLTHEIVSLGAWENNLKISNEVAEILITLDVGPRILAFAPLGGENVFKVFDEQVGGTGEELWQSRGGHRLWIAPESFPFSYYPDNDPVESQVFPNGAVTLVAQARWSISRTISSRPTASWASPCTATSSPTP